MMNPPTFAFPTVFQLIRASLLALIFLGTGCASDPNSDLQGNVKFESTPTGATVKVNGIAIGTTPVSAFLSKDFSTPVSVSKDGFTTVEILVGPHGSDRVIKPNPVKVSLKPDILPEAPGADPQAEMTRSIEVVRQYVAMGRMTASDQVYAEEQIRIFYTQTPSKTPPAATPTAPAANAVATPPPTP